MTEAWQDFGQQVDLTARIREILLNYPEGTSILKELIQNADDAKATTVKFCLDTSTFPSERLLAPSLTSFQGPALYVYNDGVFSEKDFESISRIGDSVKREEVGKTGRFGVGFNSCYHLTDVPSFVSGEHLVFFDPHCKYLPNITAANPGKKINFVRHDVGRHVADQIAPYKMFGCDMRTYFAGTLFRFPLRTSEQAAASTMSKQVYTPDKLRALLEQLEVEARRTMLFLKSVSSIQIMSRSSCTAEPQLLYDCGIVSLGSELRRARGMFLQAPELMRRPGGCMSTYELEISSRSHERHGAVSIRRYIITQHAASGDTANLADELSKQFGVPLVPWGAVAAEIGSTANTSGTAVQAPEPDGQAFCFLPLPAKTDLPVHVNGFFELSSNRRDIWHGTDMAGTGRLRAAWNQAILEYVVAPAYAALLEYAGPRIGSGEAFFRLWPTSQSIQQPWRAVQEQLYRCTADKVVAWTAADGGLFVTPQGSVFPDAQCRVSQELVGALTLLGAPIPHLPGPVLDMMFANMVTKPLIMTPAYARGFLHSRPLPALDHVKEVPLLLSYCLLDIDPESHAHLKLAHGLPLLPLLSGELATLQPGGTEICYVRDDVELQLLQGPGDVLLRQDLLQPSDVTKLRLIAGSYTFNLRVVDDSAMASCFLPNILPSKTPVVDRTQLGVDE